MNHPNFEIPLWIAKELGVGSFHRADGSSLEGSKSRVTGNFRLICSPNVAEELIEQIRALRDGLTTTVARDTCERTVAEIRSAISKAASPSHGGSVTNGGDFAWIQSDDTSRRSFQEPT